MGGVLIFMGMERNIQGFSLKTKFMGMADITFYLVQSTREIGVVGWSMIGISKFANGDAYEGSFIEQAFMAMEPIATAMEMSFRENGNLKKTTGRLMA